MINNNLYKFTFNNKISEKLKHEVINTNYIKTDGY